MSGITGRMLLRIGVIGLLLCLVLAAGTIAGEYAAYYRRGWEIKHKLFSELFEDARVAEEEAELDEEEAAKANDVQVLRILQRIAESPQTKAMVRHRSRSS